MIVARKGKKVDYVLERERELPEAEQTVIELDAGLSRRATAIIQDSLIGYDVGGEVMVSRPGTGALTACKLGIAGIRNARDEDGTELKARFAGGSKRGAGRGMRTLAPECLDWFEQPDIDEIGGEVMILNGLAKDEVPADDAEDEEPKDPTKPDPTT